MESRNKNVGSFLLAAPEFVLCATPDATECLCRVSAATPPRPPHGLHVTALPSTVHSFWGVFLALSLHIELVFCRARPFVLATVQNVVIN